MRKRAIWPLAFACQLTKATSTFNSGGISGAWSYYNGNFFALKLETDSEECENSKLDASMVIDRSHPSLGGGFKYFLFSPLLGEDSHFD